MHPVYLVPLAVLAATLTGVPQALAQGSGASVAQDRPVADVIVREQLELARQRLAEGDCEQAERAISRVLAAGRDPEALVLSAECLGKRGRFVEAIATAAEARALLAVDGEAPRTNTPERRLWDRAKSLDDQLGRRLSRLTIQVTAAGGRSFLVRLNGAELEPERLGREQVVDPGGYEVRVETEPAPQPVRVEAGEGRAQLVHIVLPPLPPPAPSPPPKIVKVSEPCPPPVERSNTAAFVGFGVGAVGLAVGATTGILAITTASGLSCPDARCSDAQAQDLRRNRALATASNIGLAVAATGLTVGLASLLFDDSGSPARGTLPARPRLAVTVGPSGAFLQGVVP